MAIKEQNLNPLPSGRAGGNRCQHSWPVRDTQAWLHSVNGVTETPPGSFVVVGSRSHVTSLS